MEEIITTVNGNEVYIALPSGYSQQQTFPVVMAIHGSGREARSYRNESADAKGNNFYARQREIATRNNHVFCVISMGGDCWGTNQGLSKAISLYNYVNSTYNVEEKWVIWGSSAGSTIMHRLVKDHGEKVSRCLGTYPVYDLEFEFDVLASCRSAWGTKQAIVDSNANARRWPSSLIGKEYLIYHGIDDVAVPINENSLRMESDVNGLNGKVVVRTVQGGHSTTNYSLYDDTTISSFMLNGLKTSLYDWSKIDYSTIKSNGVYKKINDLMVKTNGVWKKTINVYTKR